MKSRSTVSVLIFCILLGAVAAFAVPAFVSAEGHDEGGGCPAGTFLDDSGNCSDATVPSGEGKSVSWANLFGFPSADDFFAWAFGWLGNAALSVFGLFLWTAGVLLNQVVFYTVTNMAEFVNAFVAVPLTWGTLRDLANIVLIFSFLAVGIGTILRLSGYGIRQLLPRLIIVALLINFSLFLTQVVVDTSNLLALTVYNNMPGVQNCTGSASSFDLQCGDKGLSDAIMQGLHLTTVYNPENPTAPPTSANDASLSSKSLTTALTAIGGSVFVLVTTFVFFAVSILLITRFVVLVFLMVLSPMAFAFMVLPRTKEYWNKWISTLLNQAFFAPVLFVLLWIGLHVVSSPVFTQNSAALNFAQAIQGERSAVGTFVSFAIVIAFIIFALIAARSFSATGATTVINWGQGLRKWGQGAVGGATIGRAAWLARQTVGRGASRLAESERLKERASEGGIGGLAARAGLRTFERGAKAGYDVRGTRLGGQIAKGLDLGKASGKGGYQAQLEQQVKSREDMAKSIASTRKTRADRQREEALIGAATAAEQEVRRVRRAVDAGEATPAELQVARGRLQTAQGILKDHQRDVERRGTERKQQYAATLATERTASTLWSKVPRKNKEAADKIRKGKKDVKKQLDELRKEVVGEEEGQPETPTSPSSTEGGGEAGSSA